MQTQRPQQTRADLWTPPAAPTVPNKGWSAANVMLPLRLFLGVSFIAAALDKLTDPQFFNVSATGYIGNQLTGFASQSPIGGFLTSVAVPNAALFGAMILAGELAIGLGTLVGLFTRLAAFFGMVISLTLWLSTTWAVTPFFLGSDLPYAMGWLTLALAGAHPVLSLDGQLSRWLARRKAQTTTAEGTPADSGVMLPRTPLYEPPTAAQQAGLARRRFIAVTGATVLAGAVTGTAWANSLASKNSTPTPSATSPSTPAPASTAATGAATTAASAANNTAGGAVLASLDSLPAGEAREFTTPDTKEKGILIRAADGTVAAFSNICTHQGCEVGFSKAEQVLACPCHGAQFDPKSGAPVRGPATRPLKSFKVQVQGGNIVYTQA